MFAVKQMKKDSTPVGKTEYLAPSEIEKRSFEIITGELEKFGQIIINKDEYIELYNQGKAADLNAILRAALVAAGYTDEEAKKKLENWVK